jgi:hypothetical protein
MCGLLRAHANEVDIVDIAYYNIDIGSSTSRPSQTSRQRDPVGGMQTRGTFSRRRQPNGRISATPVRDSI